MKKAHACILFMYLVFWSNKSFTQILTIKNAYVDIAANPPQLYFHTYMNDFRINRITLESLNDSSNTQIVRAYFKNPSCINVLLLIHFDTLYQVNAVFPFNLKLYCILDTLDTCPNHPANPLYLDSFFLTAAQIIALPISFTYINAEAINKKVLVKWGVAQQENTNKYIVERANKEQRFVEQAQVPPNTLLQYQYTDEKPLAEDIYYRIKAVNKDGTFIYSKTILVKIGKQQPGIVVAPNPVINKQLNVYINNLVPGGYCLQLFSVEGKLLFSKKLAISNGSSTHLVELPATISKGNYVVKVLSVNDMNVLQQLILNHPFY
jgi:hypothetical protein